MQILHGRTASSEIWTNPCGLVCSSCLQAAMTDGCQFCSLLVALAFLQDV